MREPGAGSREEQIRNTVQLNTLSWYLTCVGVASSSISSWFLKFCDSCRDSIGAYNGVYNTNTPRRESTQVFLSILFYYNNPGELEKRTISIRRETRQIAENDLQSRHISLAHSEQIELGTAKKMWVRDKR